MPQLDPSSFASQLFWLVISFSLLYLLIARFALPGIKKVVDSRESLIQSCIDEAKNAQKLAADIEKHYNEAFTDARAKAQELVQAAHDKSKSDADHALAELDKKLILQLHAEQNKADALKDSLRASMNEMTNDMALAILNKLLDAPIDQAKLKDIINHQSDARANV